MPAACCGVRPGGAPCSLCGEKSATVRLALRSAAVCPASPLLHRLAAQVCPGLSAATAHVPRVLISAGVEGPSGGGHRGVGEGGRRSGGVPRTAAQPLSTSSDAMRGADEAKLRINARLKVREYVSQCGSLWTRYTHLGNRVVFQQRYTGWTRKSIPEAKSV